MKTTFMALVGAAAIGAASSTSAATLSPTSAGELPGAVSVIGGIVVDIVGLNGTRVVTQTAASSLFVGFAGSNPLTIGTQTGLDNSVTSQLGGGIAEMSVRVTLDDGDTAPGDFDDGENDLLINGIVFGDFSAVNTVETDSVGNVLSSGTGFGDNDLDTGFFFNDDAGVLASIFAAIDASDEISFGLDDVDPFDNFFDFTQGIDGSLVNVGTGPVVTPPTPPNPAAVPLPAAGWMLIAGLGGMAAVGRRRKKA